ncbi:hypothetical protein AOL_s00088g22 [Orbilia oligospora ATCC 24927]|uniref:Uncharacterized protein n=2 Tax=Orbilia oligospora TaxID=2813651 RepID=G1XHQ9_ARTOA|nr:hypothetical protein AOL_s00088g22 [Orbilia oligospora ATCC 24927]EGX47307.1 hypothetical protein AOL_s00088g22 [Orbilia oligospora ATCC 24927]KAF3270569.1 hypothetical protein TWF970_010772 [Orbilia oligospora]
MTAIRSPILKQTCGFKPQKPSRIPQRVNRSSNPASRYKTRDYEVSSPLPAEVTRCILIRTQTNTLGRVTANEYISNQIHSLNGEKEDLQRRLVVIEAKILALNQAASAQTSDTAKGGIQTLSPSFEDDLWDKECFGMGGVQDGNDEVGPALRALGQAIKNYQSQICLDATPIYTPFI